MYKCAFPAQNERFSGAIFMHALFLTLLCVTLH